MVSFAFDACLASFPCMHNSHTLVHFYLHSWVWDGQLVERQNPTFIPASLLKHCRTGQLEYAAPEVLDKPSFTDVFHQVCVLVFQGFLP